MTWLIDGPWSHYKEVILPKLSCDGWLFRECRSEKVAEWWVFKGCVGVLQADRGKGHCRPGVWAKLRAVNQHQRLGTWMILKAEEGEKKGGIGRRAGLKYGLPVFLPRQFCFSFLSSYSFSFAPGSGVSFFFGPQWSFHLVVIIPKDSGQHFW